MQMSSDEWIMCFKENCEERQENSQTYSLKLLLKPFKKYSRKKQQHKGV
jgi:hypothetical protein